MAGQSYVLDKTYQELDAAGVGKWIGVVPGASDGSKDGTCMLPTSTSQICLGVTQEAQANQNENVVVRKLGITKAYAKGAVNAGQAVETYTGTGAFQAATLTAGTAAVHFIVGYAETSAIDGGIFNLFLCPHFVSVPQT